ncbi:hypothetical protein QOZ80_2AG0140980 [Eleusine coracana subsp. coracana]|nr:hypothetical protein QOZ80_2AG0140980 [Eleusine coracana subsp. coracana]
MVWEVLSEKSETTAKDGTADTLLNISSTKVSTIGALGARAFLKPLTEQRQSYTRLCFRNRSFGLDAANVARPVLESIKEHITELDISGFVASRPEDEALGVMSIFSNALKGSRLRYLNLSDIALSEKGVMAFKELLSSQKDLEELHLMNNGLSGKAARILSKFPSTEKLKVLQMVNNCIGDDGAASIAEMVKRSPNLVNFRCSAAKIGSDGAVALAKALETCIHLDKLDLSDNLYGYEAAATLSESVTKHPVLTVIQIKATSKFARKLQNLKSAENKILDSAKRTLDGIVKNALEGSNKDLRAADLNTNMSLRVGAHCFSQSNTAKPGSMHLNCQASHEGIIGVEDGKNLPTGQE